MGISPYVFGEDFDEFASDQILNGIDTITGGWVGKDSTRSGSTKEYREVLTSNFKEE